MMKCFPLDTVITSSAIHGMEYLVLDGRTYRCHRVDNVTYRLIPWWKDWHRWKFWVFWITSSWIELLIVAAFLYGVFC